MTKMLLYLALLLCFSLSVNACSTSEPHSDTSETETPTGSEEDKGKEESTNVMFDLSEGKNGNPPVITLGSGYTMPVLGLGTYSLHGDECINAILSAIKLGYRKFDTATFYGNERKNAKEVIRELWLPEYVFPMLGLCIGHPANDPGLKPRMQKEAVYFEERYNADLSAELDTYDESYSKYLLERPWNNRVGNWTDLAADFYLHPFHYKGVAEAFEQQGFLSTTQKARTL